MTDISTVQPLSLRRNLIYAAAGRGFYVAIQFATIALVAKLGTASDVGRLTLASAIVTPLFFLTSMGLRDVHTVDDLTRYTRADYVALRLFGGSLAVALSLLAAAALHGESDPLVVMAAAGFAMVKFFGAQASLNHGIFQRAERLDFVALSHLARGTAGLAAFAAVFGATGDLPLALFAEAGLWALSFFVVDKPMLRRVCGDTTWRDLAGVRPGVIVRLLWWLLPVGLALWLLRAAISAPPLVLARYADMETVGIFGALAYVYSAFAMASTAMGGASAARLRRHYRMGQRQAFARLTRRLALFAAAAALAAMAAGAVAGEQLIGIVFGSEYQRRDLLLILLLAAGIGMATSPFMIALQAGQAFRRRLLAGIGGFVACWTSALLMIPHWAELGAAWSLVVMAAANGIVTLWLFWNLLRSIPAQSAERC